jgi:hypothetical protein
MLERYANKKEGHDCDMTLGEVLVDFAQIHACNYTVRCTLTKIRFQ